jgi:hypothetical protein
LPWFAELWKNSGSSTPRFSPSENNQNSKEKHQITLFNVPNIL